MDNATLQKFNKNVKSSQSSKAPTFDKDLYDLHKKTSLEYSDRYAKIFPDRQKKADRIAMCSKYITWNVYKHKFETNLYKKDVKTMSCRDPFCSNCQFRKSRRLFTEMYHTLTYLETQKSKQFSYYFLTLTVRNPDLTDLRSTIQKMSKAFRLMFNDSDASIFKPIRRVVRGYYRTLEYLGSNTKSGEAHPHYHILLVMPKDYRPSRKEYISAQQWQQMWKHALKVSYDPTIDIKRVRPSRKKGASHSAMVSAISEVTKYSVKPSDVLSLSDEDLRDLIIQTKGVQTFSRSQHFRQMKDLLKLTPEQQKEEAKQWELILSEFYIFKDGSYHLKDRVYDLASTEAKSMPLDKAQKSTRRVEP